MGSKKTQNIIGAVLFIAALIILWFVADHYFRNYWAYLGELIGQGIILTLIAMLLLSPVRKKLSASIIMGMVFLGSSVHISYQASQDGAEQRGIANDFLELFDSLEDGKEIASSTVAKDNGSIGDLTRRIAARAQKIRTEYENVVADVGTPLTPENLADTKAAKQARAKLVAIVKNIPNYQTRILDGFTLMDEELSKRTDKSSRNYYEGYQRTEGIYKQYVNDFYDVQADLINTFIDILDFAIAREGKFQVENGQLLFEDQASVDAYNAKLQQLTYLTGKEEKIVLEQQARIDKATSKIR